MDATPIGQLADFYVETLAQHDPCLATGIGIDRYDDEITDWSPTGMEAREHLTRQTLAEVEKLEVGTDAERLARDFMVERLAGSVLLHDAGEDYRSLNVLGSPMHRTRSCFDLMPTAAPEHWERIATRLGQVPDALVSYRMALDEGIRRGLVSPRRQALKVAEQAWVFGGRTDTPAFFMGLAERAPDLPETLRTRLVVNAEAATAAMGDLGDYLSTTYVAAAPERDAVGEERYRLHAPRYLGDDVDPHETYEWGWDELGRIEDEMRAVGAEIEPGATIPEVRDLLERDTERSVDGADAFRDWVQAMVDTALDFLDGRHFDVPAQTRACEVMLAAEGSAAAPYYTRPAEDFSRPGRVWYPVRGRTRFPTWQEVTTCYHESVPGHHLQFATVVAQSEKLTRFQRISGVSGNAEGWALYAERLMDELGFLEDPAHRFGMLAAQALRATRIVVDIGLHLELKIPDGQLRGGEVWSPDIATEYLRMRAIQTDDFSASETDRYLGIPGQAISYKVGERIWRELRSAAEKKAGKSFDLKAFHTAALDVGCVGLAQLRSELSHRGVV